jgi:hypothetical protein
MGAAAQGKSGQLLLADPQITGDFSPGKGFLPGVLLDGGSEEGLVFAGGLGHF